eukprot:1161386-Pelagomonas_calceolata.AAC.7
MEAVEAQAPHNPENQEAPRFAIADDISHAPLFTAFAFISSYIRHFSGQRDPDTWILLSSCSTLPVYKSLHVDLGQEHEGSGDEGEAGGAMPRLTSPLKTR